MMNQFEYKPETRVPENLSVSEKLELETNLDAIIVLQEIKPASVTNLLTISDLLNKIQGLLNKVMDQDPSVSIEDVRLALKKDLKKTKDR